MALAGEQRAYDELLAYTLSHGSPEFIHQYAVDAWAAQHADAGGKPIGLAFALLGLYLHVEKGRSGREVQRAHMRLARRRRDWPQFPLPGERGTMTARDVIAVPAGRERDRALDAWCASVWGAYGESHGRVTELLVQLGEGG